ncbi:hypothetical protein [Nonomuraea sp. MG754425]|uniref:hypothetical protein n=1 Tax=Nonomuraea sp. MG754425 TaxID=2570319 RepID=UPI001F45ABDE|nr:hypothetical protein [Nonomuraea sp. MG754425]
MNGSAIATSGRRQAHEDETVPTGIDLDAGADAEPEQRRHAPKVWSGRLRTGYSRQGAS